jgi:hypothetical protein
VETALRAASLEAELRLLQRRVALAIVFVLWLGLVWGGPAFLSQVSPFRDLAQHYHRLGIEICLSGFMVSALIYFWVDEKHRTAAKYLGGLLLPVFIAIAAFV